MSKSNSFKKSRKLALGIAVAMGCSFAAVAFADGAIVAPTGVTTNYDKGINGATHSTLDGSINKIEQYYVDNGVYNKENDTYNFTDKNIQINVKK